ncbi:hypothetical protein KGM_201576 [Danaus plexippus plexippus]|uniref:Uncharacterized protein n=1 Tax=Danaus plexippus plexippus TaxID=278856 RepID=A0A212ERR7_DANPL|nr:hypothetical protein KGM_201576 [Danaus plexippus plexippus]
MFANSIIFFLLVTIAAVYTTFPGYDGPNERFFFNRISSCDYTETPGARCLDCVTASLCLSNNMSIVRPCRGFMPYCNNGRCSFMVPTNCTIG